MKSEISDKPGRMGSIERTYRYDGDSGGFSIRRSAGGWIVESWSMTSGDVSGRSVLVPYSRVRSGIDPDKAINDHGTTYAQLLMEHSRDERLRVLRRGHTVGR